MDEQSRHGSLRRWLGQVHRSSGDWGRRRGAPQLCLVTRPDCQLCDEMKRVLDAVLQPRGLAYETIDVDSDPGLAERFGDVVPVLLRDGQPVAKVRLHRRRLERILRRTR